MESMRRERNVAEPVHQIRAISQTSRVLDDICDWSPKES
jgi:hypothetical protein